jgi:hypothetical protein
MYSVYGSHSKVAVREDTLAHTTRAHNNVTTHRQTETPVPMHGSFASQILISVSRARSLYFRHSVCLSVLRV